MLKIIENEKFCNKKCIDGCYFPLLQEIIVADRDDKSVLVHELSHYLWDKGSSEYLDAVLDISKVLGVTFWEVIDITAVSEMVNDYEILIDELAAYFMEQVYKDFPELVLDSVPVYRIILERGVSNE